MRALATALLLFAVSSCAHRSPVAGLTVAAQIACGVLSNSSCPPPLACPQGYTLGSDSRCHRN